MAATGTPTPNIGLRRPQGTDPASVDDINYNSNLLDTKLGAVRNTSVQEQINSLNSKITDYRTWTKIADESTTANTNFDETVSVAYPSDVNEIMFALQRVSNGRTFATSIIPATQFQGGAIYAMGSFALFAGSIEGQSASFVNAVAIYTDSTHIELATMALSESIKMRVYVR